MSWWVNAITKNWKLKAGSVFVALLLFWYVQYSRTITRVMNIRVDRPEIPANLTMSSRTPSFMNVKIYGPREVMDFNVSEFRISLKNPRPEVGTNIYRAQVYPELPEGVGAVYRTELPITLDRVMVRELPVEPILDINLGPGLRPGYMWTKPRTLRVVGPEAIVSRMNRIRTDRTIVAGSRPVFSNKVLISQLPEFVALDKNQPFDVDINLRVLPDNIDPEVDESLHLITDIPIRCSNDLRGVSMKVMDRNTVDVLVMTNDDKINIKKEQLSAMLFCAAMLDSETQEVIPSATITNVPVFVEDRLKREGVTILDVIPPRVALEFEKSVVKTPYELRQGLKEHLIR
jgi:hypothetical protein